MKTRKDSDFTVVFSNTVYDVDVLFAFGYFLRSEQRIAYEQNGNGFGLARFLDVLITFITNKKCI